MPRRKAFRTKLLTGGQIKGSKKIVGLAPLIAKLNALGDAVEADQVYSLLLHGARVARDEVKDLVPYGARHNEARQGPHVRDVIFASEGDPSKDKKGPNVLVGVASRKLKPRNRAVMLERGTSKTRAQPFFRPGIQAARAPVYSILRDGMQAIISRTVNLGFLR